MHQEDSRSTVTCWKCWWETDRWHRRRLCCRQRVDCTGFVRQCMNCSNVCFESFFPIKSPVVPPQWLLFQTL